MKFRAFNFFIILVVIFLSSYVEAKTVCIDSHGEAAIIGSDIPSAKAEAISRAKWNAIEQVAGVKIKAQTVVQNFSLIDDAVIKQIRGVITGYKIQREWKEGDIYKVIAKVCVNDSLTGDAVSMLAINNSMAVFIPLRKPYGEHEETNILSETLIGELTKMGVKVVDITPAQIAEAEMIESAMKKGNYIILRSLMYKNLSNLLLIGKVDYTISTRKGQDIGYGLTMPVNNVTTRLTYRVVARETDSNRIIILASGTEEAKGMALNVEDATVQSLKNLSEKFVPIVFDKISKYMHGIARKISVRIEGLNDLNKNFEIKEMLQNIAWVTEVEEKGMGDFLVSYPENPVYLANSLNQKGLIVVNFLPNSIILRIKN
uniref:Flagellar assembly protein T N-terminal domain-containing protein n=1 Tax=Thermodesulfovibrio aggregans TaxID=86166 RepID=A0A7C4AIG9_9BACT